MALWTVEGVTKRFGGVVANHDISFSVDEGEILGLIGRGGIGTVYRARHCQSRAPAAVKLLGPAPAAIERIRGRSRWHLLLLAPDAAALLVLLDTADPNERPAGVLLDLDFRRSPPAGAAGPSTGTIASARSSTVWTASG